MFRFTAVLKTRDGLCFVLPFSASHVTIFPHYVDY